MTVAMQWRNAYPLRDNSHLGFLRHTRKKGAAPTPSTLFPFKILFYQETCPQKSLIKAAYWKYKYKPEMPAQSYCHDQSFGFKSKSNFT